MRTTKVRLWQIRKNGDTSITFNTMPPLDGKASTNGREVCIGRSVMHHISRDLALPNGWVPCTVEVEEWLAEKENL